MKATEIKQGHIYEVITDSFFTSGRHNKTKRPVKLRKGEKIEIRFAFEWHFRTEDNYYFHATPEMITENCKPFGKIFKQVSFNNKANLAQILELELYEKRGHRCLS